MRGLATQMVLTIALFVIAQSEAGAGESVLGPTIAVDTIGGSHLVGAAGICGLPLTTAFGLWDLPLDLIAEVRFPDHDGTTRVEFRNGDRVTGRVALAVLKRSADGGPHWGSQPERLPTRVRLRHAAAERYVPSLRPPGDTGGISVLFRTQDLKESWNEPGSTTYILSLNV